MQDNVPFDSEKSEYKLHSKRIIIGVTILILSILIVFLARSFFFNSAESFSINSSAKETEISDQGNSSQQEMIYVHVVGCVVNPGVVGVFKDSRLIDAINAAGGFTDDANSDELNLARIVVDGEQIKVLSINSEAGVAETSTSATDSVSTGIDSTGKININTASIEQLCTLNGVGNSTAQKIIDERSSHGPFKSIDDLLRVSGIGEKKLASIRDYVTV